MNFSPYENPIYTYNVRIYIYLYLYIHGGLFKKNQWILGYPSQPARPAIWRGPIRRCEVAASPVSPEGAAGVRASQAVRWQLAHGKGSSSNRHFWGGIKYILNFRGIEVFQGFWLYTFLVFPNCLLEHFFCESKDKQHVLFRYERYDRWYVFVTSCYMFFGVSLPGYYMLESESVNCFGVLKGFLVIILFRMDSLQPTTIQEWIGRICFFHLISSHVHFP